METITQNQMYVLLQEINHRLRTLEIEIHELRGYEPELRPEFIEKMKKRANEPTVKIGTLENFRKRYNLD